MQHKEYRIHPGIGIARLGNSEEEYFIGPESPGIPPLADGDYKDQNGAIKRQAARFRVFEYRYENGILESTREINSHEANITWSVHLVNKKAAGSSFPPVPLPNSDSGLVPRNRTIDNRPSLIIDAEQQFIRPGEGEIELAGSFLGKMVTLGHLNTDENGQLIVLGGWGESGSVPAGQPIRNFANNDNWHDDVSDGPVTATIQFADEDPIDAEPAWILVGSPSYAPNLHNVVTWYDQALSVATQLNPSLIMGQSVSFTRDIYPILKRTVDLQWVSSDARHMHGNQGGFNFDNMLDQLSDNGEGSKAIRQFIFFALASPDGPNINYNSPPRKMPWLRAGVDPKDKFRGIHMSLAPHQHNLMRAWYQGNFDADWQGSAPAPIAYNELADVDKPAALDRAALEACIGGPFFPGIECSYPMALLETYGSPLRISVDKQAGDLTAIMACPWQADFQLCAELWWPAQRPNSTTSDGQNFHPWLTPGLDAVFDWDQLNFIIQQGDEYLEQE